MNWEKFSNGNVYSYSYTITFRFREKNTKKNWNYSDGFLIIPEPNWAAENNSESDSEYIDYAGENELRLINTFGGLFLDIDGESADNYDVECKLRTNNQYVIYNQKFTNELQSQLATVSILLSSQDLFAKYYKLHKKSDPTSQKKKILYIKQIVNNILKEYNKGGDFDKFYNAWIKFEVILNIVEVRDHFIHNFETFLLGLYFIEILYDRNILANDYHENIFKWTFTSIMHDIGYAVEKSKKVLNRISGLYSDIGMNTISSRINTFSLDKLVLNELYTVTLEKEDSQIGECISFNLKTILQNKLKIDFPAGNIYEDIFKTLEKSFNHGLVSSVLLLRQLLESNGLSYTRSDSYPKILDSSVGILFHHYKPENKINLSPQRHLMIILLLVVDELQEWNRPIEGYGANLENSRLEFELNSINSESDTNGNVIFNISIKLKTKKTPENSKIILNILNSKQEKLSWYNYLFENSEVILKISFIDSRSKKIHSQTIIISESNQQKLFGGVGLVHHTRKG